MSLIDFQGNVTRLQSGDDVIFGRNRSMLFLNRESNTTPQLRFHSLNFETGKMPANFISTKGNDGEEQKFKNFCSILGQLSCLSGELIVNDEEKFILRFTSTRLKGSLNFGTGTIVTFSQKLSFFSIWQPGVTSRYQLSCTCADNEDEFDELITIIALFYSCKPKKINTGANIPIMIFESF